MKYEPSICKESMCMGLMTRKHPRILFFEAFSWAPTLENDGRRYIKCKCFTFLCAHEAQRNSTAAAAAVSQGSKIVIS